MSYVMALDQGTTSSRAIIFDREGNIIECARREFEQIYPRPGWVEHDPEEIWSSQIGVAQEAMTKAGLRVADVVGIGITNQRETTVLWERASGRPIGNAIVWQDRRTAELCDRLKADGLESMIRERTGLVIDAYFSASKIAWMLEHVPGARQRAAVGELVFGTVDSWLIHKLTKGALHVTDATNASRTMLLDIRTGDWDDELLALFDIPRAMMPQVRASSEIYGEVAVSLPLAGVPIAGIIGDQQAALAGQLCFQPGQSKNTYGTGCFALMHTGRQPVASRNRLLSTIALRLGDELHYALEGSVFIGGAVVQWLRDGLGLVNSSEEVEALANTVEDNGGVYLVPAFVGLGAPHWDPYARGTITGMTRGSTAGHIARAALESIAFQVADLIDAMREDVGEDLPALQVDGGAAVNDTLMQFQADLLGRPVIRPRVTESTALGAALMAGLAVGYWKDPDELAAHRSIDRVFEPRLNAAQVADMRGRWNATVERARAWERPTESVDGVE